MGNEVGVKLGSFEVGKLDALGKLVGVRVVTGRLVGNLVSVIGPPVGNVVVTLGRAVGNEVLSIGRRVGNPVEGFGVTAIEHTKCITRSKPNTTRIVFNN